MLLVNVMNRKGFTLVELLATITILGLVVTIGGISISGIINNAKNKEYELLISNIKSAVETYYQECTYGGGSCSSRIGLKYLLDNGYLSPNGDGKKLINPKTDGDITGCVISYSFTSDNKFKITGVTEDEHCPQDADYNG